MHEADSQAARWDRFAAQDVSIYGAADPETPAAFLRSLLPQQPNSDRARALELGAGIGTVACALAGYGADVTALDMSPSMVERINANSASLSVTGVIGDMADIEVPGPFDLIYVVTSTIYSLLTQQRQIDCFASVAERLGSDGNFVVDAYVPLRLSQITQSSRSIIAVRDLGEEHVDLSATTHIPAEQRLSFREIRVGNGTAPNVLPIECRYIWPSEMDLMARLAGLRLRARYAGWDKRPFDSGAARHVSIYGRS